MAKVYFDKSQVHWVVLELEDYYYFKTIDSKTNEESNHILSWSKDHSSDLGEKIDRVYDVEIDEEKYYFLFINNGDGWNVISEDSIKLEKLLKDKNIVFTGEYLLTVN